MRVRTNVAAMAPYIPGEQPAPGSKVIKLNTNENPYPPSPKVAEAIRAELGEPGESGKSGGPGESGKSGESGARLRLYSDPKALALRQAAADVYGFPLEQILHGNGSDELLAMIVRAFVDAGQTVAYPYPTYVLYETLARAQAAQIATYDFAPDFALPPGLLSCHARVVFLASPNSPSGTVYTSEQLRAVARNLKDGVLVIDEAYAEFAETNHLALAKELDNVIVLRTFSKSHSLAGMRLGLLFASKAIVAELWKVKDSYNLDRLAIAAGAASLRDTAWLAENTRRVKATRERLARGLEALGLQVVPSQSNFVFARAESSAKAAGAYQFLKNRGILIRYFSQRLLDDGLRISVGTDAEIGALLDALKEYFSGA